MAMIVPQITTRTLPWITVVIEAARPCILKAVVELGAVGELTFVVEKAGVTVEVSHPENKAQAEDGSNKTPVMSRALR